MVRSALPLAPPAASPPLLYNSWNSWSTADDLDRSDRGVRVSPRRVASHRTDFSPHGNLRNTGVILGPIRFGINIGRTLPFTAARYFGTMQRGVLLQYSEIK